MPTSSDSQRFAERGTDPPFSRGMLEIMESIGSDVIVDEVSRHDTTSRDMSRHTLTIKTASELFASLGVPRSPRSVQRFCEAGSLDCIRVKGEKTEQYFISEASVRGYAQELRQLENISRINDTSRHDAPQRDTTRHVVTQPEPPQPVQVAPEPDRETVALRTRIDTLEKENLQLQIDRAAKEQVINQLVDERRGWLIELTEKSRELGRLETRVELLEAPKEVTRHDATEFVVIPSEPVPAEREEVPTAVTADTPPPRSSFFGKFFGN